MSLKPNTDPRKRVLVVVTHAHVRSVTGWDAARCKKWIAENGDDLRATIEDSALGILAGTLAKEISPRKKD